MSITASHRMAVFILLQIYETVTDIS